MSFNKITIVGYLGRDPELRYTAQGTAVCKMSVATTERRRSADGESEEHTTWFRVTVWGRQAELANEYLGKGRQVYIEGRLRLEEYADREGNPRISPEVNATDIQFLGQRNDFADARIDSVEKKVEVEEPVPAVETRAVAAKPAAPKRTARKQLVSIEEDEIPF
ncbi:MAG TPA: single-stranded DNA-binding protein [Blastocatellia bacterium]|nr:single-stranded DNA-binding protein [Blastocatellia bacterium]HMV84625.1 single-stranded DNA-binding protein [Blastocatellia bacterium]HMX27394.1 single-stranded DNA-binding protein [Blastocatellia bacterium]HMY75558.1 single-stranded DNA-binding protein [Blastocatellia bacterium]HMZ20832.1 single-stranded DNA-binding protein [Blastocatellia bacterium]